MYINAGDTLTIQIQGQNTYTKGGSDIVNGVTASLAAQGLPVSDVQGSYASLLTAITSLSVIQSFFVQFDVTAPTDFASEQDVLSIVENVWNNVAGEMPTSAVVSDINGASTGIATSGSASTSTPASNLGLSGLGGLGTGLQQLGTTTLVLIAVIIIALLYFLTTEGGRKTAQALV